MKQYTIKQGNNIDTLKEYPDNHFDSIVTDPPYGIEFLAKEWDKNTGAVETWAECFRVLKPGGYLLAFSAARTYHNLATNIEGVGFEIRDQLMWLYASGFPKAQDIGKAIQKRQGVEKSIPQSGTNAFGKKDGKSTVGGDQFGGMTATYENDKKDEVIPTSPEAQQWSGWKTALKPAHEPIVMARKPFKGSCIDNVLTHGVGALNIDATRINYECDYDAKHQADISRGQENATNGTNFFGSSKSVSDDKGQGRFPSNVLGEVEGYQKFFYCPKVSRAERHIGFETKDIPAPFGDVKGCYVDGERFAAKHQEYQKGIYTTGDAMRELGGHWENQKTAAGIKAVAVDKDGNTIPQVTLQTMVESKASGNNHPTVKPVALMKYLVTLVTPAGGKVLDPFCGSGSTGMAAVELGYDFTGCELDPDYVNIAETRIDAWYEHTQPDTTYNELFEEKE
jgi:DNA modification methylase